MHISRLGPGDQIRARAMFATMAAVFDESIVSLSEEYLCALLARPDFWAVAAIEDEEVIGGLTAHALPMTRSESTELFIYDVAVGIHRQRRGVGRALLQYLLAGAAASGIDVAFVPADNEDTHAMDFYRALGGVASPVTLFEFSP